MQRLLTSTPSFRCWNSTVSSSATPDVTNGMLRFGSWFRVIRSWSRAQRREMLIVLILATICEATIRFRTLPAMARTFGVGFESDAGAQLPEPVMSLDDCARMRLLMVRAVMRNWPVDGACLRHALVAGHRIRRLGPVLKVGVARHTGEAVSAHAWLEIGGRSLDVDSAEYLELSL